MGINVLSLFDGMSCGQIALNRLGIHYDNYLASELDKYAIKITQKNFPKTIQLGDVRRITAERLPVIHLLMGGSPCQDLSSARPIDTGGGRRGLAGDKSGLLHEYLRIRDEVQPNYWLLENVVPAQREWKEEMDELLGVKGVFINSDRFVQQNRPRIYWTNIPIKPLPPRPNWQGKFYTNHYGNMCQNKSGVAPCVTTVVSAMPLRSPNKKDRLSITEIEALQGVDENYTEGVSFNQRYRMLGNGWTVPVIEYIFQVFKCMGGLETIDKQADQPYQINIF